MQTFIKSISRKAYKVHRSVLTDDKINSDLCPINKHLPIPFSKSKSFSEIKLVIIGQDPTGGDLETRKNIKTVLMLDEYNNLSRYISTFTSLIGIDLKTQVYATNLYKCFFKIKPQTDERILTRHFRYWIDLLIEEVCTFPNATIITLGEPLIHQLIHSGSKKVNYYWDYIGSTKSNAKFLSVSGSNNFLKRPFYPLPHLPTYNQNKFYSIYFNKYCSFIKSNLTFITTN